MESRDRKSQHQPVDGFVLRESRTASRLVGKVSKEV